MKLIPKSQIANDLASERANQIKEGLSLAKKVDVLRETLASLEAQHAKFLAGTQGELIKATEELQRKKQEVESEIAKLEIKRQTLLKPLDDEWASVKEAKEELNKQLEAFDLKENELTTKEKAFKKEEKRIEKARIIAAEKEAESENLYRLATEDRDKAKELRTARTQEYKAFQTECAKRSKEQDDREKALINHAHVNEHNKKILDKREKALTDKEKFINDKYETLMRTLNRLKK